MNWGVFAGSERVSSVQPDCTLHSSLSSNQKGCVCDEIIPWVTLMLLGRQ